MGGTSQWHTFTSLLALLWFILQNNQFVSDRHIFPGYSLENIDSGNVKMCNFADSFVWTVYFHNFYFVMENTNLFCLLHTQSLLVFPFTCSCHTGLHWTSFGAEAYQASSHR